MLAPLTELPPSFSDRLPPSLRQGKMPDTVVGRVYVDDPDDWDLPDKTFSWLAGQEYRNFHLDRETGNITMRYGTPNGSYPLQFQVHSRRSRHLPSPPRTTPHPLTAHTRRADASVL